MAYINLRQNPLWFFALAALLVVWSDVHFYFSHRLTHWKPLYRAAHYLHHRNTNVGPWSGLSMHPIEHLIYFTRWVILFVLPSHPIHMLFLMQRSGLGPAAGHTGFDQLVVKKGTDVRISIDTFFHCMHHRYFECNYGAGTIPLDRWFGSFHDGSADAHKRMRSRRSARAVREVLQ